MSDTALVTGGSGFIGGHLVSRLLRAGQQVRVLDLEPPRQGDPSLEFIQGSVTDRAAVRKAIQGVRHVYHLASIADLWARDKHRFIEVNHVGTRVVLEEAGRAAIERMVHCSTEAVLKTPGGQSTDGGAEQMQPRLEDMPGAYCRGKLLAEQEVLSAARCGLPAVVVSPTVPLGPGDRNLTPPTRMVLGFLNGEHSAFLQTTMNLVDARDVAEGHIRAVEYGQVGQRYVLGAESLGMSALLELLEEITGLSMPKRRVPYWLARSFATINEFLADHVTHRPPVAPLTGVRLAASPRHLDNRRTREALRMNFRPIRITLADSIADYQSRQLITRTPAKRRAKSLHPD